MLIRHGVQQCLGQHSLPRYSIYYSVLLCCNKVRICWALGFFSLWSCLHPFFADLRKKRFPYTVILFPSLFWSPWSSSILWPRVSQIGVMWEQIKIKMRTDPSRPRCLVHWKTHPAVGHLSWALKNLWRKHSPRSKIMCYLFYGGTQNTKPMFTTATLPRKPS